MGGISYGGREILCVYKGIVCGEFSYMGKGGCAPIKGIAFGRESWVFISLLIFLYFCALFYLHSVRLSFFNVNEGK